MKLNFYTITTLTTNNHFNDVAHLQFEFDSRGAVCLVCKRVVNDTGKGRSHQAPANHHRCRSHRSFPCPNGASTHRK
jgi:hypothetical protein